VQFILTNGHRHAADCRNTAACCRIILQSHRPQFLVRFERSSLDILIPIRRRLCEPYPAHGKSASPCLFSEHLLHRVLIRHFRALVRHSERSEESLFLFSFGDDFNTSFVLLAPGRASNPARRRFEKGFRFVSVDGRQFTNLSKTGDSQCIHCNN